jgi:hypothetical protein
MTVPRWAIGRVARMARVARVAVTAGIAAAIAGAGGAAGCAHATPISRPYAAPAAADLLRALEARQAAVKTMNARARATSWIGGERLRATVLMLVDRAGRLRFEAEVSLQGTVSILTTDDGRFQLLDLHKNQLQHGPACPANVASLIRIPLAPDEVAAILLGDVKLPAPSAANGDATVEWDGGRGADVLIVRDQGREIRVLFRRNGEAEEVIGAAAANASGPLWRTSYEDLENGPGGVRLPSVIRFAERAGSFDDGVEIRFKDRTPNAALRPTDFTIVPPAGAAVIEVGCGEGP